MPTPELPSKGILRVRVADDLVLDGGTWHLATDYDRHPVAVVELPTTPMYRQVAAYLETKPAPPEGNPKRADEARAAVVDYLRYDDAWPPPVERALPFLHGLVGPDRLVGNGREPGREASVSSGRHCHVSDVVLPPFTRPPYTLSAR
jgi:hypothetical protein